MALFSLFQRDNGKRPKNSKKGRKIALLSLYLLYLYHYSLVRADIKVFLQQKVRAPRLKNPFPLSIMDNPLFL